MEKNIETEYKILVSKETFEELLAYYPSAEFKEQVNTYFDNDCQDIAKAHGAMRIRKKDGYIFTLKMPSEEGLLEFESYVTSDELSALNQMDIQELLDQYHISGPFHKTATLITNRAVIDTGFAELCFDSSRYGKHHDYEIEYEITKPHDGMTAFQEILDKVDLHYERNCDSKIKRALDALCEE